jgi:hypothetical protein
VAVLTEPDGVMTTGAGTRVIKRPDRVDFTPVGHMRFRQIVWCGLGDVQILIDAASIMAVKAEGLLVTVLAIIGMFFCVQSVLPGP